MALKTKVQFSLEAMLIQAIDLGSRTAQPLVGRSYSIGDGTGLNQANIVYADRFNIAASGTMALDLNGGGLLDPFGATLVFARVKGIAVQADASNVNNVNVVRDGTNGVPIFLANGDGAPVMPNGIYLWVCPTAAGVVVTAGTGDLINLVNSGAGSAVNGDIVIIGANA